MEIDGGPRDESKELVQPDSGADKFVKFFIVVGVLSAIVFMGTRSPYSFLGLGIVLIIRKIARHI